MKRELKLNPGQKAVTTWRRGPVVVSAGAGTGKTAAIAETVARLVKRGISPGSILLLTFTRKAAREMLRRPAALLDHRCEQVAGGTFHSFAVAVLRRHGHAIQVPRTFTILDQGDAEDVIQLLRVERDLSKGARRFPRKETLLDIFSRSRNRLLSIKDVVEQEYPQSLLDVPEVEALFIAYQAYKRAHYLQDFDDLLESLLKLLKDCPAIAARLSGKLEYILVDEYQDTNRLPCENLPRNCPKNQDDCEEVHRQNPADAHRRRQQPLSLSGLWRPLRASWRPVGVSPKALPSPPRQRSRGESSWSKM